MNSLTFIIYSLVISALQVGASETAAVNDRLNATSFWDARSIDCRLFGKADAEALHRYRKHPELSISVRAAWEDVLRSVKGNSVVGSTASPPLLRPTKESLDDFVRFAEGRLKVPIPSWWKSGLAGSRRSGERTLVMPTPRIDRFYDYSSVGRLWVSKETHLTHSQKGVIIQSKDHGCFIAESLLKSSNKDGVSGISATFSGDRCYVAFLSTGGNPYSIHCIDWKTSERIWTADVWATGPVVEYAGRMTRPSLIEIRIHNDRLYVFGIDVDGVYSEAFAMSDGKNLLRFSTSY